MSSLFHQYYSSCPPSYATAIPVPDYSSVPLPCEQLVELALNPPPYLTRSTTTTSTSTSTSSTSESSIFDSEGSSSASASQSRPSTSRSISTHQTQTQQNASNVRANKDDSSSPSTLGRYISTSGNIELDLGPRHEQDEGSSASAFPTYGLNGRVSGVIRVKKMAHVQRVVVMLEGRAQTTSMQGGLPSGHTERTVLHLPLTVYTASSDKGKAKSTSSARTFPFEFTFPTHTTTTTTSSDDSDGQQQAPLLLPPTFRNTHPGMEGWVKYTVRVHLVKSGLWPRETLSTVVHYLPKFYLLPEALLWPAISLMDAKRFGLASNEKWKTVRANLLNYPSSSGSKMDRPELSVSIPVTARAIANYCFPVNVTLRLPSSIFSTLASSSSSKTTKKNPSPRCIDDIIHDPHRVAIQMIKMTTLIANGQKSAQVVSLARAYRQQVEHELVSRPDDERIVRAWFRAGTKEGEASWDLPGLIQVQYLVRVTVTLEEAQLPIFKHDEVVQMFTHSKEQYESPFEVHDEPARNLLLASALGNNRQRF